MKKISAALAVITMALLGLFIGTGMASAHTPHGSASCEGVVGNGTSYNVNDINSYTLSVDGKAVVGPKDFGQSFSDTAAVPQDGKTHTWAVDIHTTADPTGSKHWSQTFEGSVGPCGPVVVTTPVSTTTPTPTSIIETTPPVTTVKTTPITSAPSTTVKTTATPTSPVISTSATSTPISTTAPKPTTRIETASAQCRDGGIMSGAVFQITGIETWDSAHVPAAAAGQTNEGFQIAYVRSNRRSEGIATYAFVSHGNLRKITVSVQVPADSHESFDINYFICNPIVPVTVPSETTVISSTPHPTTSHPMTPSKTSSSSASRTSSRFTASRTKSPLVTSSGASSEPVIHGSSTPADSVVSTVALRTSLASTGVSNWITTVLYAGLGVIVLGACVLTWASKRKVERKGSHR